MVKKRVLKKEAEKVYFKFEHKVIIVLLILILFTMIFSSSIKEIITGYTYRPAYYDEEVFTSNTPHTYRGETFECTPGDVDLDTDADSGDTNLIRRILEKVAAPTECADQNNDGVINQEDLLIVSKIVGEVYACSNDCGMRGVTRCNERFDGLEICGDFDYDPCLEWGEEKSCLPSKCRFGVCY